MTERECAEIYRGKEGSREGVREGKRRRGGKKDCKQKERV